MRTFAWLDVDPSTIRIDATMAQTDEAQSKWERARTLAASARDDEQAEARLRRESVRELREIGMTFADIATVLNVSTARAHQLAR